MKSRSAGSPGLDNRIWAVCGCFPWQRYVPTSIPSSAGLGNIVLSVFTPVPAKHTKTLNLVDMLSVGVTGFEPLQRQVELWRKKADHQYSAFIDGKLEAPKSLLSEVHRLYFDPEYPEF
jgi:hypothetical protein